jgi:hypothetical protein
MATMTKATLKAELQNDPQTLGYAALVAANNDVALAALLNDKTKGGSISRVTVTAAELQSCVVAAEYASLTADQKSLWQCILLAAADGGVRMSNANIRAQALAVWAGGTTTRTNLGAMQDRTGSRAEALRGEGASVSFSDVGIALRNP